MNITTTSRAWIADDAGLTQDQLLTPEGAQKLIFSNLDLSNNRFILVGTATITVAFDSRATSKDLAP